MTDKVSILFICTGNICRSPTAHGIMQNKILKRDLMDVIIVDSAGTHGYHVGHPPDHRARQLAWEKGLSLDSLTARQVSPADFDSFNYIIVMDDANLEHISRFRQPGQFAEVHKMMAFADYDSGSDVPDPYYGGVQGFQRVFDQIDHACERLLAHVTEKHGF